MLLNGIMTSLISLDTKNYENHKYLEQEQQEQPELYLLMIHPKNLTGWLNHLSEKF